MVTEAKNNSKTILPPFQTLFSESSIMGIMRFFDKNERAIGHILETWRKPLTDASGAGFCRQLVGHGLLSQDKDGTIMLSYISMVYIEVMRVLIQFGARPKIMKSVKALFDEQYCDHFTSTYSPLSGILISSHVGLDIEFTYSANSDGILIYDYLYASLFLAHQKDAMMQFSLIPILNKIRKRLKNVEPIKTSHSIYDGFAPLKKGDVLTNSEIGIIEKLRHLGDTNTMTLKSKKGENGKYIVSISAESIDEEFSRDLETLCKKYEISDFADLNVKRRNGGIANVKMAKQEIL